MPALCSTPSPVEFGAPAKFSEWRDGQDKLFLDVVDSSKRFSIHNAPVGCGKSLSYMTAGLALGKRIAVLTESKALQAQLFEDFGAVGLFDIQGLQNYPCRALLEGGALEKMWSKRWGSPMCDVGPCTAGIRCDLKNDGCGYFDAWRIANMAQMVSTNYAYWIAIHRYGQGLGAFDILVLDEAHAADSQLSSALAVEFVEKDFRELRSRPPKATEPLRNWRMWARVQLQRVQGKLEFFSQGAKIGHTAEGTAIFTADSDLPDASELRFWKRLETKFQTLAASGDDWVLGHSDESGNIRISPVWVRNYAEPFLFRNIPRVVLMSATVRPKIEDLLLIPSSNCEFTEYPSTFPVSRRPIYWIPTVALSAESGDQELRTWVVRIDNIIARRLDRKGLVHTVSFARQKYLVEHSRFRHLMIWNTSGNTQEAVTKFRNADAPAVLVSPSIGTGFDFPFDAARYQIIGKVPFRDMRDPILQMQDSEDPDYTNYMTAQDLIQIYGRTNRDPRDFSETLCVDNNIEWFVTRYSGYRYNKDLGRFDMNRPKDGESTKDFFPEYFLEAFQRVDGIPDPPSLEEIS